MGNVDRQCCHCKVWKPVGQFGPSSKRPGELKLSCRSCCREASKKAAAAKRWQRENNAKGRDYSSRNANLRRLGFTTYRDYLASDLWREVRLKVYATKGRSCYLCGSPATELHHNRYHENDLVGKRLKYINPICRSCHQEIEFREGRKTTLGQASSGFRKRRRLRNRRQRGEWA